MTGFADERVAAAAGPIADPWADGLRAAYAGRSVLVTGHTGFKGSWLTLWLRELGAEVTGYALDPPTSPSNFELANVADALRTDHRADIRDRPSLEAAIRSSHPDVILHLAAQSVVFEGYAQPSETFSTNVLGTAALLDAVRAVEEPCAVVVVTSDKCYHNDESGRRFVEDDKLGGHDPYSASKAGTELLAAAYRESYFAPEEIERHGIAVATARAGNVIGGGDWTAHGIVADIVRSLDAGAAVELRRPNAIRPWQHVLEPLGGYLTLAMRLMSVERAAFCRAWNFGPEPEDEATVRELTERFLEAWGTGRWEDGSRSDDPPEAGVLRLSIDRARTELGWRPRWGLPQAIDHTVKWYGQVQEDPASARAACLADIDAYMRADTTKLAPVDGAA